MIGIEAGATSVFPRLLDWPYPNIDRGKGVWLYTTEGREILDACSGGAMAASLGHGLGEIAEAAWERAKEMVLDPDNAMVLLDEINIVLRNDYLPIAEVTALGYTAPIFVTLGAAYFFGETLHARRIMAVVIGFVGAMIILRPGFQEISSGQLAQLTAAPLFAASFLLAKGLTREFSAVLIVAMLSLFCTLTLLPGAILQWRDPTLEEVLWLGLVAVFATAGHYTLTRAFAAAPLTVTQPVGFLQLVWAAALGMLVFGETLDPFVFLGGGIVVAAVSYISHREAAAARRMRTPPAVATKT